MRRRYVYLLHFRADGTLGELRQTLTFYNKPIKTKKDIFNLEEKVVNDHKEEHGCTKAILINYQLINSSPRRI